ncbi:hypothetical protein AVEN_208453-1 [Araneus ventricosus]|uniref:Uncharacterized protein n=1 Tax=Araneus ventricosus TaxID=182803 RepID=A0A4Y2MRZ1_ARAVE|nr:hypothetical protein AVEN_208453-1 [Araneus ventricosus]
MPTTERHTTRFWMAGLNSAEEPRKVWSGFMEIAGKRCYDKSAVISFPFVNLQPSNPTSINNCLRFTAEECSKRKHVNIDWLSIVFKFISM